MSVKLLVPPLGRLAKLADKLMVPVMYLVSGAFTEKPQRTHRWNNLHLQTHDVSHLDPKKMVHSGGLHGAIPYIGNRIRFHIPPIGGWRNFLVVVPEDAKQIWYVGWWTKSVVGVSQIPLHGPVRLLQGPEDASFFGISAFDNTQIRISKGGVGRVGDGGPYKNIPLL